ncbi:MAG: metallophosphoesterase family protein [Dehalococcoidia bacterium]
MRIGLLSDTHQPSDRATLWDEIYTAFDGVDLIMHGGDIVHPMVLDWLDEIAPTIACRGNNDMGWDDPRMQEVVWKEVDGLTIAMAHAIEPENRPIAELQRLYFDNQPMDIMITGDTHMERIDHREGVLQINSGSPTLPHLWSTRLGTIGLVDINDGCVEARIVKLGETEGRRNPGIEYTYTRETGVIRHDQAGG